MHSDLQAALDEMSRTRALLRSAPRRRAPRNFTLSPAMVGVQKQKRSGSWWSLFPVLSFTSALATLALVASILFQLIPAQMRAGTRGMQPQQDQVANIVQQTMTAMQVTMPAAQAPLPAAGNPSPESGRTMSATEDQTASPAAEKQAAPTATAAAALAVPAAPALEATEAPAQPVPEATTVPDQFLQQDNSQPATPPVVAWGSELGPAGMGGGGSGGDGQGGSSGSLLGPPAAAEAGIEMGKGGGGGAGDALPPLGQNIVIPQESVNTQDATTLSQPETAPSEPAQAPAQANPQITGPGPILGVPSAGQGGQIVDKKAILGQPGARQSVNNPSAPPQSAEPYGTGESAVEARPQTLFGFPVVLVLQVLLALIAIATGAAAFIVRKRAR